MIIYLAGGFTVANVKGREAELAKKTDHWYRLFSFHFKELIFKSTILNLVRNDNISRQRVS